MRDDIYGSDEAALESLSFAADDDLLTVAEVAELADVAPTTVRGWARTKRLAPEARDGQEWRFRVDAVRVLLRNYIGTEEDS